MTSSIAQAQSNSPASSSSEQGTTPINFYLNVDGGLNLRTNGSFDVSIGSFQTGPSINGFSPKTINDIQIETHKNLVFNKEMIEKPTSRWSNKNNSTEGLPIDLNVQFRMMGDPTLSNGQINLTHFESPSLGLVRWATHNNGNDVLKPKDAAGAFSGATIDLTLLKNRYRYTSVVFTDATGRHIDTLNGYELELAAMSFDVPMTMGFHKDKKPKTQLDWQTEISDPGMTLGNNSVLGQNGSGWSWAKGKSRLKVTFRDKANHQIIYGYYQISGRFETVAAPQNTPTHLGMMSQDFGIGTHYGKTGKTLSISIYKDAFKDYDGSGYFPGFGSKTTGLRLNVGL